MQPRAKLVVCPQPLDVPPRLQQRFLHRVFGLSAIIDQENRNAVQALAMRIGDQPESLLVSALALRYGMCRAGSGTIAIFGVLRIVHIQPIVIRSHY